MQLPLFSLVYRTRYQLSKEDATNSCDVSVFNMRVWHAKAVSQHLI
jgi:hypothetical protein